MNADDYIKQHPPKAQRSSLEPFDSDLRRLRGAGMSLAQIAEFLAASGVVISAASLSRYLKKNRIVEQVSAQIVPSMPVKSDIPAPINPDRPPGMTDAGWREMQIAQSKLKRR